MASDRKASLLAVVAALALVESRAEAADVEIASETIGQAYQVAGADGSLNNRDRLDQYLGLHVWNIGPKDAQGFPTAKNQFYVDMSLRFEQDFGDFSQSRLPQPMGLPIDTSNELRTSQFDLLYAYVGARDLFGLVDLKLGRQIQVDQFEFIAFDGLWAQVKTPYYVAVEAWGGLQVDGAMPFDSPLYRPDGTAPSALSVHDTDFKPTVGVALRSFGFRDLDARFSYRHTFSPAQNSTDAERATGATDGTSEEKLAWSVRGRLANGMIVPWFGLRYNVLVGAIDDVRAGVRLQFASHHAVQLEYLYALPTFDGDSIWNLFVRERFDDLRASYDVGHGCIGGYARAFLRIFHDNTEDKFDRVSPTFAAPSVTDLASRLDWGGNLGAKLSAPRGFVRLDGYVDGGYGGQRMGVDASTRMRLYRDLLHVEGRATYVHFEDDLRPIDSGDSFGLQLGARVALGRGVLLHVIGEDNINHFYSSQLRLYAVLDLGILLGAHPAQQALARGIGPGLGQFGNPLGGGY